MKPLASVLVTGASGMLGIAIQKTWGSDSKIIGISRRGLSSTLACNLCDEASLKKIFELHSFSLVIHTAAQSDVDGCEKDPEAAYENNAIATKNVATFCEKFKIPLIHVSTDYVFEGKSNAPYKESDTTFPIQIYGLTKLAAEYFVKKIKTPYAIVRTSWLFGSGNPKNFVNVMISKVKSNEEVGVLADQISSPTFTEDLAKWFLPLAQDLLKNGGQRIFHACNSGTTTRFQMTLRMRDLLNQKNCKVTEVTSIPQRPAARPAYSAMDNRLFNETFNLNIRSWEESIRDYICASS